MQAHGFGHGHAEVFAQQGQGANLVAVVGQVVAQVTIAEVADVVQQCGRHQRRFGMRPLGQLRALQCVGQGTHRFTTCAVVAATAVDAKQGFDVLDNVHG
jgi:hypothetical protein